MKLCGLKLVEIISEEKNISRLSGRNEKSEFFTTKMD